MRNCYIIAVLLFVSAAAAFTEEEYQVAFTKWTHEYNRAYSADEFQSRYAIFKARMDFIEKWNADKTHTHTVALNKFSDLTNAEFRSMYLGHSYDASDLLKNAAPATQKSTVSTSNTVYVDWTEKGAVTPVKNQNPCGSCWSFAATGGIEGAHYIATGSLVSLSEQNLIDCSKDGNNGCQGGRADRAFRWVIANGGIDTEASYPFTAQDGVCKNITDIGATISNLNHGQSGDENALTQLVNQQPISVAIDASHDSFSSYSSGIYDDPTCSSTSLDHAVLVVGYGTDDSGNDYYIVKNSWGTDWGLQGYIWMARNKGNRCGIATDTCYPIV